MLSLLRDVYQLYWELIMLQTKDTLSLSKTRKSCIYQVNNKSLKNDISNQPLTKTYLCTIQSV